MYRAAGYVCLVSSVGHKSAGHVQWLKNIAKANSAAPETQYTLVPHIPLIHRFNEYLSDYSGCKCDGSPSQQNQAGLNRVRVRLGLPSSAASPVARGQQKVFLWTGSMHAI